MECIDNVYWLKFFIPFTKKTNLKLIYCQMRNLFPCNLCVYLRKVLNLDIIVIHWDINVLMEGGSGNDFSLFGKKVKEANLKMLEI